MVIEDTGLPPDGLRTHDSSGQLKASSDMMTFNIV